MGKRNFLVDGVSCSGKTAVATELERRGYHVVHGDRQLKYRGDRVTGAPVEQPADFDDDRQRAQWISEHLCWPLETIQEIVADDEQPVTFLCGGSRNSHMFVHLLDAVFVLDIDRDTLVQRLDARPEDDWGGRRRRAERDLVLRLHTTKEDLLEGSLIDATRPLGVVVDDILQRIGAPLHAAE